MSCVATVLQLVVRNECRWTYISTTECPGTTIANEWVFWSSKGWPIALLKQGLCSGNWYLPHTIYCLRDKTFLEGCITGKLIPRMMAVVKVSGTADSGLWCLQCLNQCPQTSVSMVSPTTSTRTKLLYFRNKYTISHYNIFFLFIYNQWH